MTKERIEVMREAVLPFCKEKLVEINYEGLGKSDAEEFEKDFNELLNLASKALEKKPCEDCVSRQQAIEFVNEVIGGKNELADAIRDGVEAVLSALPPVTPVACIAKVTFDKDDLQKFVDEAVKDIVVERKKGKWIKKESITGLERYYECSNCSNHCLYEYVEIGFQNAKTKFCPNCGSEMEVEE